MKGCNFYLDIGKTSITFFIFSCEVNLTNKSKIKSTNNWKNNFWLNPKKLGLSRVGCWLQEVLLDADGIMDRGYMESYGLEMLARLVEILLAHCEDNTMTIIPEQQEALAGAPIVTKQDQLLSAMLFATFLTTLALLYVFPLPVDWILTFRRRMRDESFLPRRSKCNDNFFLLCLSSVIY